MKRQNFSNRFFVKVTSVSKVDIRKRERAYESFKKCFHRFTPDSHQPLSE